MKSDDSGSPVHWTTGEIDKRSNSISTLPIRRVGTMAGGWCWGCRFTHMDDRCIAIKSCTIYSSDHRGWVNRIWVTGPQDIQP